MDRAIHEWVSQGDSLRETCQCAGADLTVMRPGRKLRVQLTALSKRSGSEGHACLGTRMLGVSTPWSSAPLPCATLSKTGCKKPFMSGRPIHECKPIHEWPDPFMNASLTDSAIPNARLFPTEKPIRLQKPILNARVETPREGLRYAPHLRSPIHE
jgi:hypothetical protein